MTNVLIGIIGVILFIGLAIAGALFLGPRFQESRNTAIGAATIQAVSQIANASNLYIVENNAKLAAGSDPDALRVAGYLKAVPSNPSGAEGARILSVNANNTGDGVYTMMRLDQVAASKVCAAIVRQTANANDTVGSDGVPEASNAAQIPFGPAGCFRATVTFGNLVGGQHYAFARF